jgi:hypothetical protein
MPARWFRPKCRFILALTVLVLVAPASVNAQTGSVTLQGHVSETVALSILPDFTHSNLDVAVVSRGSTVQLTLSSTDGESSEIRVPLLVRSNSGFKVSAVVESQTAELTHLSVIDVRPTGRLVSPGLVNALAVTQENDVDVSRPMLLLSGPRVSIGGSLDSSINALQVTLLIRMKPQSAGSWLAHLTIIGTAGPLIQ